MVVPLVIFGVLVIGSNIVAFSLFEDNDFSISNIPFTDTGEINSYNPQELPFGLYSEYLSNMRAPPPLELSSLGESFDIFAQSDSSVSLSSENAGVAYSTSITQSDFEKLQSAKVIMVPSFIPEGMEIKKAIYRNDGMTNVKLILLPQTVNEDDVITEVDMFDHNGIYILISYRDFVFESEEEFEEWRDGMIGDSNRSKKIELNEWKGIITSGEPQKGELSAISLTLDHNKIQIRSTAYDASYLKQIAESMIG